MASATVDASRLLKAPWEGHTAALQFMLGILLPIGERKHAIRSRRLQEDEIMTACIATSCTEMVLICLSVGLRRNVLHELAPLQLSKSCFPPRAGEGLLFRKMRLKAMRKCGNVTLNACDKADDAKQSIPKGAINKKYTFPNGFCKFPGAINGAKRADIGPTGGPMRQTFHDLAVVPLSKSCFPPKAGSIFLKNGGYFVKKVA